MPTVGENINSFCLNYRAQGLAEVLEDDPTGGDEAAVEQRRQPG